MGLLSVLLEHPEELPALIQVRYAAHTATYLPRDLDLAFCYDMLNRVSRSFAVVIQQLHPQLKDSVCLFYLILRALDTVEDDMSIPDDIKLPILHSFHEKIYDPSWTYVCGTKDYRRLMIDFAKVSRAFLRLEKRYQAVIADITKRMGRGMAKFIVQEVESVAEYDEYCHYVAGLVGIGLSDLFVAAELEDPATEQLSNSMGLFLQKTNIIRDYLEDINEEPAPRMFWPKEIWGKNAKQLEEFQDTAANGGAALRCLNEMVTDALRHAPDSLTYLASLRNPHVFRFCAIPQIMALGTLAECYNNINLFRGVVKMRRGLSAVHMVGTRSMHDVYTAFHHFAVLLAEKVDEADPSATLTLERTKRIESICVDQAAKPLRVRSNRSMGRSLLILLALLVVMVVLWPRLHGASCCRGTSKE